MNEALLHYVWKHRIFRNFDFRDTDGNPIEVLQFGTYNTDAGPDFSMAKIKLGNLELIGHIELHVKSSDWLLHRHDRQTDYQSVVLHVVYEHDLEIASLKNAGIPTLELKPYLEEGLLARYQTLDLPFAFIPCEKLLSPSKVPFLFAETALIKKLDEKSIEIEAQLQKTKNSYEAVLFHKLAYSFGLKVNAKIYQNIAENIDFRIIQKIAQHPLQLESLLLGKARLLEPETEHNRPWRKEFDFLKAKFSISNTVFPVKFLRLMPPSFPTIRLSQLAQLYHRHPKLFSKILKAETAEALKALFRPVKAAEFWDAHYTFEKTAEEPSEKKLSEAFIEILILNAVLPVLYTYHKNIDPDKTEEVVELYRKLKPEKNSVVNRWKTLGMEFASALDTQAFVYHHGHYCRLKKCADCSIGYQLLKK